MSNGIVTKLDGTRWSNRCDLCDGSRKVGFGAFRNGDEPECPWCRAVRLEYGNYFYPITEQNKHLFDHSAGVLGTPTPIEPLTDAQVDAILNEHFREASPPPEGHPVERMNWYKGLIRRASLDAVIADRAQRQAVPQSLKATNEEIAAWVERHDLGSLNGSAARCAFEDAESHHFINGASPTPPADAASVERLMDDACVDWLLSPQCKISPHKQLQEAQLIQQVWDAAIRAYAQRLKEGK